jgi:hypothetical protein
MAALLIYGIPRDYHAEAVRWGLEQLGVETHLWVAGNLPDFGTLSVRFDGGGTVVSAKQGMQKTCLSDVQLIWNRRYQKPQAPDHAAAVDRSFIEQQCFEHVLGVRQLLGRHVKTINPPRDQAVAARKTVQIDHAQKVGFKIPPTLISNDYEDIRAFWELYAPLVVKPFRATAWANEGTVYAAYTAPMPEPHPGYESELALCPQIFQARVLDKRDVRVIAFGKHCFAAELDNTGHRDVVDVRDAIRSYAVEYKHIAIPQDVQNRIAFFLEGLSLEYGAFDFAIDGDGDWVFLECNEAGQFLFLEVALPELKILEAFCYWVCGHMGIEPPEKSQRLTVERFEKSERWDKVKGSDEEGHKHYLERGSGYRLEDKITLAENI